MNEATPITLAELDERLAELETLEDFPRIQAAETVGVDLLSALLDEIKILQQPWQSMPERQQTELIDRLRQRIKDNVQRAVALIAAENRVTVVATLEEVKFKGGIEAKLKLSKANVHRLDLADNVGEEVLVCIMPAEQFTGGMDDVRGDADQPDLLETDAEEDFDPDSDPLYQHGVRYLRSGECRPSISSIQRILKIGYNRAARMVERMEAEQVVTPIQADGSRELLF